MSFTVKSFDDILADIIAWTISQSHHITDLTPGSVLRSFAEGAALSMEELYIGTYLGFKRYLDNIQSHVFDFKKKEGTKSSVNVVFTRSISTGTTVIPKGTRVQTATDLIFILVNDEVITAGNTDSNPVQVKAEKSGYRYNVPAHSITVVLDDVQDIISVDNPLPAVGGVSAESDIAYKKRFQAWIEGLGKTNLSGLQYGALNVEGITSVSIIELFPPINNVNVEVYIDDGSSGGVSNEKLLEVQSIIDGDGTEDNPGYRAAGVNVEVKKPSVITQNVEIVISAIPGVDIEQIKMDVTESVTEYINTLGVGAAIIYNEIIAATMQVYGVLDCAVTTPATNVSIGTAQVGRIGTMTLTVI